MAKQSEFNVDMERYITNRSTPMIKKRRKNSKPEKSVTDMYPDLDSGEMKVHVIDKDQKMKKLFNAYKKKILSMLKKEEREIEKIDVSDKTEEEIKEVIEDVEEEIQHDLKEQVSFTERFRTFIVNMFQSQDKVEEDGYSEDLPEEEEKEVAEEIEEEFEEELVDEEIAEKNKFGSWIRSIFGGSQEKTTEIEESEAEAKITKLILYKAKMEKDVKLALMIAQKYIKQLPSGAKHQFERSGDKREFEDALKRLNQK